MDKARYPHTTRTWTLRRTRVPYRQSQPSNLLQNPRIERLQVPSKPVYGLDANKGLAGNKN
jgi:hypothetical protein